MCVYSAVHIWSTVRIHKEILNFREEIHELEKEISNKLEYKLELNINKDKTLLPPLGNKTDSLFKDNVVGISELHIQCSGMLYPLNMYNKVLKRRECIENYNFTTLQNTALGRQPKNPN
jgi:hypothetical protein